jgi:hypothetical protein
MTLGDLLSDLYRTLNYTSTPPAATTTRLTAYLNDVHRQVLSTPGLDRLRDDTITFASVANQPYYGLPPSIARIEAITDRTTQIRLRERSRDEILLGDPALVMTGPPDCYINRGFQQVQTQPAAATGLWAVSSSAADNTQTVWIETIRTGGYAFAGSLTLNGLTRVQLGTFTDHIEVTKFYLGPITAGTVSLFDAAAAGNELARIRITGTYARYLQIQLYPTPASAITYFVDYVRNIPEMANQNDEPLLPLDFHSILADGALWKEYTRSDDTRRGDAARNYELGMSQLKYFVTCPPDFLPSRLGRIVERSRFGANYPATRY